MKYKLFILVCIVTIAISYNNSAYYIEGKNGFWEIQPLEPFSQNFTQWIYFDKGAYEIHDRILYKENRPIGEVRFCFVNTLWLYDYEYDGVHSYEFIGERY